MWDNLTVRGFQFNSTDAYLEAKRESEAIDYICAKMDVNDPQIALKVYYKLLERQNLRTIIGMLFLKELRDRIINAGIVEAENLKYIHTDNGILSRKSYKEYGDEDELVADTEHRETDVLPADTEQKNEKSTDISLEAAHKERTSKKEKKLNSIIDYYKSKLTTCRVAIGILILVIIAMFAITLTSKNSPFIDAEVQVQDKYAGWAEELQNWEKDLTIREEALKQDTK